MAKRAAAGAEPAQMRVTSTFVVGVRIVNEGEVFSADDQLVADHPAMFEPVPAGDGDED